MKFAFRMFAGIFAAAGSFAFLMLIRAVPAGDMAKLWLLLMAVVGCYWIAFLLYRGATRPLK